MAGDFLAKSSARDCQLNQRRFHFVKICRVADRVGVAVAFGRSIADEVFE
jgi:hypothetical protein